MLHNRSTMIKLNQCLFGYDEGHRLLATSRKLTDEAESTLLLHSDLVPGLQSNNFKSYWTGIPVPSIKCYALMHTWAASDMARPGCVWTHVLLIDFSDMAVIKDLSDIRKLFFFPLGPGLYEKYIEPLHMEAKSDIQHGVASDQHYLQALRALYIPTWKGILSSDSESDDLDDAIFAVWSQQWPRLRRSLSFSTALETNEVSVSRQRFDLRLIRRPIYSAQKEYIIELENDELWLKEPLYDLLNESTDFRRFLWRYGPDQRRGKERFQFLAELYQSTRIPILYGERLSHTLKKIIKVLPELHDGKVIKDELLNNTVRSSTPLLPVVDNLDLLYFFANEPSCSSLSIPTTDLVEQISGHFEENKDKILSIAEKAIENESFLEKYIALAIMKNVTSNNFFLLTSSYPAVRVKLAKDNPNLLDSQDLVHVETTELLQLLDFITEPETATKIINRLLVINFEEVSSILMVRFPNIVENCVFNALSDFVLGQKNIIQTNWMDSVRDHESSLLATRLLDRVNTTSELMACVILLRLDIDWGSNAPSSTWAKVLSKAQDNISGKFKQILLTYLLSMAITHPESGCELLLEYSFEQIHSDLKNSRLSMESSEIIFKCLPDLFWWQQWDVCLRLRIATVNVYVSKQLNPKSFKRLTKDSVLFKQLQQSIDNSKLGRRFLERIGD